MSIRPKRSSASATSRPAVSGSPTSPASTAQSGSRAAWASRISRRLPCSTSFTPRADSASAVARPIPLVAPVITATLPANVIALPLRLRDASHAGQHRGVGADAVVEADQLELLVRRMHAVVVEAEAEQDRVDAEILADRADRGNRSPGADQVRLLAEHVGQPLAGGGQIGRVGRDTDRRRTADGDAAGGVAR